YRGDRRITNLGKRERRRWDQPCGPSSPLQVTPPARLRRRVGKPVPVWGWEKFCHNCLELLPVKSGSFCSACVKSQPSAYADDVIERERSRSGFSSPHSPACEPFARQPHVPSFQLDNGSSRVIESIFKRKSSFCR